MPSIFYAEIRKKPQINSPESRLVWRLASIPRQMHTLKGSAAKYLMVTEDNGDSRIFLAGADHLGMRPEEILYIGDSFENNINLSQRLGMKAMHKDNAWTHFEVS